MKSLKPGNENFVGEFGVDNLPVLVIDFIESEKLESTRELNLSSSPASYRGTPIPGALPPDNGNVAVKLKAR